MFHQRPVLGLTRQLGERLAAWSFIRVPTRIDSPRAAQPPQTFGPQQSTPRHRNRRRCRFERMDEHLPLQPVVVADEQAASARRQFADRAVRSEREPAESPLPSSAASGLDLVSHLAGPDHHHACRGEQVVHRGEVIRPACRT